MAGLDLEKFSERAAYYLGEINALHPFREGNGRAQREFINHLAYKNGYVIEWAGVDMERVLEASIESFQKGDNSKFEALIASNIKTREAAQGREQQEDLPRETIEEKERQAEDRRARIEKLFEDAERRKIERETTKDKDHPRSRDR